MEKVIIQAIKHAKAILPQESCGVIGVVNGKYKYFACKNISEEPEKDFIIDPLDYIRVEDVTEIVYIVHSHPYINPKPSQSDLVSIEKTNLPWLIVNPTTEQYTITKPSGYIAPYVGREFSAGVLDCWTVVRDYYNNELNMDFPDFDRTDKWWERGEDLYRDNYEKIGFVRVFDELKQNDFLLLTLDSSVPNHSAIYLGNNRMLHHVQFRLSSIDIYGGYWQKNTWAITRHQRFL